MSKKALGRGLSALFSQMNPLEQDLVYIDIDQIDPTETQPRHIFKPDKLEELAQSIRANGIIQPIVARRNGERFQIIAGERRWRAAQIAGLHKVPCIVKDVAEESILELSLIENIQREELNPIEEAHAYKKLLERFGTTQEDIARRVGKDRSSITNSLRLLKLPAEVQRLVEENNISMGHARALLALESAETQRTFAENIVSKSLSVRETERLIKKAQQAVVSDTAQPTGLEQETRNGLSEEAANITAAELKLSRKLAAPVKIRFQKEGGFIEIKFSSKDDLTRLYDLLTHRQDF